MSTEEILRQRLHELEWENLRLLSLLACWDPKFLNRRQVRHDGLRKRLEEMAQRSHELGACLQEQFMHTWQLLQERQRIFGR